MFSTWVSWAGPRWNEKSTHLTMIKTNGPASLLIRWYQSRDGWYNLPWSMFIFTIQEMLYSSNQGEYLMWEQRKERKSKGLSCLVSPQFFSPWKDALHPCRLTWTTNFVNKLWIHVLHNFPTLSLHINKLGTNKVIDQKLTIKSQLGEISCEAEWNKSFYSVKCQSIKSYSFKIYKIWVRDKSDTRH